MLYMTTEQTKSKLSRKQKIALAFIIPTFIILVTFHVYSGFTGKEAKPFNVIVAFSLCLILLAACLYSLNITRRITLKHILFFFVWFVVLEIVSCACHFFNTLPFNLLFVFIQTVFIIMLLFLIARTPKR